MKIAIFISNSPTSGWNMGYGIINALRRLGHEVIGVAMPTEREASEVHIKSVKHAAPQVEELKQQDLIIVSGPEHIGPWIDLCYGKQSWKEIDIPKAVWLHESCSRDDYSIDFDGIKWCGDQFFFPAIQDADFHDQEAFAAGRSHFLPFGVDEKIFKPRTMGDDGPVVEPIKNIPVGFLGLVYPKRAVFLRALSNHKHPPIRYGMCAIQDIRGYDWEGSMRLLAQNTREIKVFFNLPSMSRLLVAKVFEVMACGTFLLTPMLPENRGAEKNEELFENGRHLIYYSPSNLPLVAQMLRGWASPEKDAERQKIAEAGCREVHEKHTLATRVKVIFEKMNTGRMAVPIAPDLLTSDPIYVSEAQAEAYKQLDKNAR